MGNKSSTIQPYTNTVVSSDQSKPTGKYIKQNNFFDVEGRATPDPPNIPNGLNDIIIDMNKLKQTRDAARQSETSTIGYMSETELPNSTGDSTPNLSYASTNVPTPVFMNIDAPPVKPVISQVIMSKPQVPQTLPDFSQIIKDAPKSDIIQPENQLSLASEKQTQIKTYPKVESHTNVSKPNIPLSSQNNDQRANELIYIDVQPKKKTFPKPQLPEAIAAPSVSVVKPKLPEDNASGQFVWKVPEVKETVITINNSPSVLSQLANPNSANGIVINRNSPSISHNDSNRKQFKPENDEQPSYNSQKDPIKKHLHLSAVGQSGGDPNEILADVNNTVNKYMFSTDAKTILNFENNPKISKDKKSNYLGKGTFTAVFGVSDVSNDGNIKTNLIMRMTDPRQVGTDGNYKLDENGDHIEINMDEYIDKWKSDRKILKDKLLDMYMYGDVIDADGFVVAHYTLTKQYYDYEALRKLSFTDKIKLIGELIQIIANLQKCGYAYRDLKISNIGYEQDANGNKKLIVLDHDLITFLHHTSNFFDTFDMKICNWMCSGTYPPVYFINEWMDNVIFDRKKIDKLCVSGLACTIIDLIYGQKTDLIRNIDNSYGDADPYYKLYAYFVRSGRCRVDINKLVKPAELSDNSHVFLKALFTLLFSRNYSSIPDFSKLLKAYTKAFSLNITLDDIPCPNASELINKIID
jgi:hypothetical protein